MGWVHDLCHHAPCLDISLKGNILNHRVGAPGLRPSHGCRMVETARGYPTALASTADRHRMITAHLITATWLARCWFTVSAARTITTRMSAAKKCIVERSQLVYLMMMMIYYRTIVGSILNSRRPSNIAVVLCEENDSSAFQLRSDSGGQTGQSELRRPAGVKWVLAPGLPQNRHEITSWWGLPNDLYRGPKQSRPLWHLQPSRHDFHSCYRSPRRAITCRTMTPRR